LRLDDRVARITFAKPPLNVFNIAMMREISSALGECAQRELVAIVFDADKSCRAFSAGVAVEEHVQDMIFQMLDAFHSIFRLLEQLAKPTIALVDGAALGGGCELVAACDIVIASDRSRFAIPAAKVGIVDGNLPRLLREEVSPGWLRYWMFTGAPFPASEAFQAGLLSKVVPADQLDAALQKCLTELKSSSREAIKACKRILNEVRPVSRMTDAYISMMRPVVIERLKSFAKK